MTKALIRCTSRPWRGSRHNVALGRRKSPGEIHAVEGARAVIANSSAVHQARWIERALQENCPGGARTDGSARCRDRTKINLRWQVDACAEVWDRLRMLGGKYCAPRLTARGCRPANSPTINQRHPWQNLGAVRDAHPADTLARRIDPEGNAGRFELSATPDGELRSGCAISPSQRPPIAGGRGIQAGVAAGDPNDPARTSSGRRPPIRLEIDAGRPIDYVEDLRAACRPKRERAERSTCVPISSISALRR